MTTVRMATRSSKLAQWQANRVSTLLRNAQAIDVEIVLISTVGDERRDVPIHALGGTGVFVKEVQQAVLDGRADIAVHSAKDLPSMSADGLLLACVPERGDVRDVLVGARLDAIPNGGTVATGSVRRRAQLLALRSDLVFAELRGNIDTRLDRAGDFDAIALAAAGIDRIGRADEIAQRLEVDAMLPQVGQGALAVECRASDNLVQELLATINDTAQHACVTSERAFLAAIGGGCDAPIGAFAQYAGAALVILAVIADGHGQLHRTTASGTDPTLVGQDAARALLRYVETP